MLDLTYDEINKLLDKKLKKLNLSSERFNYSTMSKNAERELNEAKLKDRSYMKLEDWIKLKYYKDNWCQSMLDKYSHEENRITHINCTDVNVEEFRNKYEKLNIPVIIKGNTKNWDANNNWTFDVKIY
jgi:histone arginine demethylase JMJD6